MISFGETAALLAAVFWSVAVIIFKSVGSRVSPFVITPAKNVIAILLFGLVSAFTSVPIWYDGLLTSDYYRLIISGCLGMGVADLMFLYSLNKIGANRIAIINTLEPSFVLILSFFILGVWMNVTQLIGFLIISGAVLIIAMEKSSRKDIDITTYYKGILLMICAISFSSTGIIIMKPVLDKLTHSMELQIWATMFRLFPGVLITVIILLLKKDCKELLLPIMNKNIASKLLLASGLGTFFALIFWIVGYSNIPNPALASILGQMSAVFIIILAKIYLKEAITPIRIISMCIAFFGMALVVTG